MLIFNPIQLKELGYDFYKGKGFAVRYQQKDKLGGIFKTIFIPMGPIIENEEGIENFFEWCSMKKMTRIIIELPLIFSEAVEREFENKLIRYNFNQESYFIHDEETLLIGNGDYKLDSDTERKIRYAEKRSRLKITEGSDISDAYKVYGESAMRIGFKPKPKKAFEALLNSGLLVTAYSLKTKDPIGFILGNFFELRSDGGQLKKFSYIVYSGTNQEGRKSKVGYLLRDALIKKSFSQFNVHFVDQGGAGRKAAYPYLSFKKQFGGEYYEFGGRYVKTVYF